MTPIDVDPRQPRRLFVPTDGVDVATERRLPEEQVAMIVDPDHDDDRHRNDAHVPLADLQEQFVTRSRHRVAMGKHVDQARDRCSACQAWR